MAISWYTSGTYNIPVGTSRYSWYGFTGTPSVMFDGYEDVVGGLSSGSMFLYYDPIVSAHQGNAPLAITATFGLSDVSGVLNVHIEVTDPVVTSNNTVHFVIVEDGEHDQENLARDTLADEPFALTSPPQSVDIVRNFVMDPTWNPDDIGIVVFVQSHNSGKQVLQAAYALPDYAATVVMDCEPDLLYAPWHLDGPAGYTRDGAGDATVQVWDAGEYTVTWSTVGGWTPPAQTVESQTVAEGGTITFLATYSDPPFTGVTTGPLGDTGPGRGVAMVDYDQDGDLDISVANYNAPNLLLRNDGGESFVDVASGDMADAGPDNAVVWADYDNDGDPDLYITKEGSANVLLENQGAGVFAANTPFGLDDAGTGCGAAWGDFNNDSLLDIYIANYGSANKLMKCFGEAGGSWFYFEESGAPSDVGPGIGATWADYDTDGDLDLYLTNRLAKNLLFENGPAGFFEATGSNALANINNGAGAAWADYDNDGDLDCYLANDGNADVLAANSSSVFSPIFGGPLQDVGYGKSVIWGDFDNDMDQDLFVSRTGQADLYMRNDGPTNFVTIPLAIAESFGDAAGAACGDVDGDGDLDIYVANDGGPNVLLRNDSPGTNHWLHVKLVGVQSNASAVGARVRLVTAFGSQIREVTCGSGYFSQNSPNVEFGLWFLTQADTVEVTWPTSGREQTFVNVPADQVFIVREDVSTGIGDGQAPGPLAFSLHPCYPNPFNPATNIRFELPKTERVQLAVYTIDGQRIRMLANETLPAGPHQIVWNGRNDRGRPVPSGRYFYKLEAGSHSDTRSMTLIK
ncbi:MAG: FG-GAP-like repeat-containing protein [Planctomycetota bacterium]